MGFSVMCEWKIQRGHQDFSSEEVKKLKFPFMYMGENMRGEDIFVWKLKM